MHSAFILPKSRLFWKRYVFVIGSNCNQISLELVEKHFYKHHSTYWPKNFLVIKEIFVPIKVRKALEYGTCPSSILRAWRPRLDIHSPVDLLGGTGKSMNFYWGREENRFNNDNRDCIFNNQWSFLFLNNCKVVLDDVYYFL